MLTKKFTDFSADLLDTVRSVIGEAKKCPADCECEKCEAEDEDEDEAEDENGKKMKKEGYVPTADEPTEANKKTAQKIRDMMAKEKKPVKEHTNCGTSECCGECDTAEQIDEVSKATLGRYINKAKDSIDMTSYRSGIKDGTAISSSTPYKSNNPLEKKLSKRHKGIETAVKKLTKEDAEQIDELSKDTMGRYINKAATKMGSQGVTAGLKIAADEKSSKNFKDMGKREKGIKLAVSKLTKEEQDFVDSLNDADMEQIDELSKKTLGSYVKKASGAEQPKNAMSPKNIPLTKIAAYQSDSETGPIGKRFNQKTYDKSERLRKNRETGIKTAVNKLTKEDIEISEARGRPKKAGGKDFTIHPKTKEKLMHNNPEHMKKIERLQKFGVLEKPKTEASQHIMNQLSKAKTSMTGGSTIHFTHGDSKHVSGTHAAKLIAKYQDMKPHEKEDFQKKIGHSHEQLMKHV